MNKSFKFLQWYVVACYDQYLKLLCAQSMNGKTHTKVNINALIDGCQYFPILRSRLGYFT